MNQNVDFAGFIYDAKVTESPVPNVEVSLEFFTDVLELAVASALLLDQVKKHIFYRTEDENNPGAYLHNPLNVDKARIQLDALGGIVERLQSHGLAHEAANPTTEALPVNTRLVHAFVGKFTESGELLQALLKALKGGIPVDKVHLAEEMADDKWYDAIAFDELGADMNAVLKAVILKLRERYKDKFLAREAAERNVAAERRVLEENLPG